MIGHSTPNGNNNPSAKNKTHAEWLKTLPYVHNVREPTGYLFQEAADLQKVLYQHEITFCFIGGIPLQRWGEIRNTEDVDLTIFCELGGEPELCALDRAFTGRAPCTFEHGMLLRIQTSLNSTDGILNVANRAPGRRRANQNSRTVPQQLETLEDAFHDPLRLAGTAAV